MGFGLISTERRAKHKDEKSNLAVCLCAVDSVSMGNCHMRHILYLMACRGGMQYFPAESAVHGQCAE